MKIKSNNNNSNFFMTPAQTHLLTVQTFLKALLLTHGSVIYRYAGTGVSSPALGSMSKTVSRIAYGVALPTILVAAVVYIHVSKIRR